ncbi:hypothetical protein [Encephalitozoon cuniculi GB-M1]|uniref:Uncharacterized protein n=2 Tax=Encephalitozoon cuniculi TaxID=6035 RepID=Q8SU00_ENCCU|nr:uncharacterized protein ECU11_1890 [Encephalitozoon cuniculi GB-M1]AGE94964.1 hypothetical protein ECU11_1890 [Encephalitozoon cuniculi]KMV65147.1 hypothetical protein M970_111890 [Encephalitozoon cuniculi EcunIII-L]UYI26398.1 hypothetical protein J0A71_01g02180 [Encephalitozoon cuniculi]CAD26099.1 hypothetical protein [Encephalitozoon cuniculi GB-M1]
MQRKIRVGVVNGTLITAIVMLGAVIIYLSGYYKLIFLFSDDVGNAILMNKEDIERNIYGDGMKIKIPSRRMCGEMWRDFQNMRTDAIIIISQGEYVRIFNIISKEVREYKHDEYIKHINGMGGYLLFLNALKYDIRNFLRNTLENDERDVIEDSPIIYGCLILPNTDGGLKFMSKSKIMDVNCTWNDVIDYVYPEEESVSIK